MDSNYLDGSQLKKICFWVLTLCLLLASLAGILSVWGVMDAVILNRFLGTLSIITAATLGFLLLNLGFAALDAPPAIRPTPNIDPAFQERLKKAKEQREAS